MTGLDSQLELMRQGLGASHLSLLIYAGDADNREIGLIHAGKQSETTPELENLDAAESLITGSLASRRSEIFPSRDPDCHLISIPVRGRQTELGEERRQFAPQEPSYWLGVRGLSKAALGDALPLLEGTARLIGRVFELDQRRSDPLTGLLDRAEFERSLSQQQLLAARQEIPLAIFLLSRDAVGLSPTLLPTVADALQTSLRDTDQCYRYAQDTLALLVPGLDPEGLESLGAKLTNIVGHEPLGHLPQLPWKVAATQFGAEQLEALAPLQLTLAAETTLRRCQSQSINERLLIADAATVLPGQATAVAGIISGAPSQDYRNMQLLWDAMGTIGDSSSVAQLAKGISQLLADRLQVGAALIRTGSAAALLLASTGQVGDAIPESLWRSLREHPVGRAPDGLWIGEAEHLVFTSRSETFDGVHLLICDADGSLTEAEELLLTGLLDQLVQAFERLNFTQQELHRHASEASALRRQVAALGQQPAINEATLQSPAMQRVSAQVSAWAKTDEIVLITGESGAGKEVIARRLHQQSQRLDGPLITVDCASIPATLIEAELFGRIKGAYTGADSAAEGYVRKAAGGTLFLDEIGELPLESQSKLLRLLQEKQVSPVGSTDVYTVDVRIIAATNRVLSQEVNAGRFRGDLMYRLQVLELELPALRERREDIVPLGQQFLSEFNEQYDRRCSLTDDARRALESYAWPGNVRELKNRMLKACLQAGDDPLTASLLALPGDLSGASERPDPAYATPSPAGLDTARIESPGSHAAATSNADCWANLQAGLRRSSAIAIEQRLKLPLGAWLTDAFLDAAYREQGEVAKHAARILGLPESTFRRQLERLQTARASGQHQVHELFAANLPWIEQLVRQAVGQTQDQPLLEQAKRELLRIVSEQLPQDVGLASALMGVTPPTYRRHLQELTELAA